MSEDRLFDPGPPTRSESFYHASIDNKDWSQFKVGAVHAGTKPAALERAGLGGDYISAANTVVHELGVKPGGVLNTPDDPVSDRHANKSLHSHSKFLPPGGMQMSNPNDKSYPKDAIEEAYLDEGKGVYYTNDVEDGGSLSVATTPDQYEHRASYKVTAPTVAMETSNSVLYNYPSRVDMPDAIDGTYTASQPRLFGINNPPKDKTRRHYLGSPQWDRYR